MSPDTLRGTALANSGYVVQQHVPVFVLTSLYPFLMPAADRCSPFAEDDLPVSSIWMRRTLAATWSVLIFAIPSQAEENLGAKLFRSDIQPLLESHCYDCHGYGMTEGRVALDAFESPSAATQDPQLWWRVLKMLRAGMMPPVDHSELSAQDQQRIEAWIKSYVFRFDPESPHSGHVTLRRLNRVEYRNTIRDLVGVDYDSEANFPPEDTGHGFDNLGEVLNMSPLHLEKYLQAAKTIAYEVVPQASADERRHSRFYGGPIPDSPAGRRELTRRILGPFATLAYRRPIDSKTLQRLVGFAERSYSEQGQTFESALADAYAAILSSPRFLFLIEETVPNAHESDALLDEFSLASRLSYFFWSTMPDEELLRLAQEGRLRAELPRQIQRMTSDERWQQFVLHFAGQWLRARDIEEISIEVTEVLRRDEPRDPVFHEIEDRYWTLNSIPQHERSAQENKELKRVRGKLAEVRQRLPSINDDKFGRLLYHMRLETELHFEYVFTEDRPLLELLDCDYAFLNQQLAEHYGIEGVAGKEMRRVELPADSPRGGILTQGTMLLTTSNPDRTSPVKRGLYILENVLGIPPAPPPSDVPELEDERFTDEGHAPTLRQSLERHREDPLCSSCHNRMDPLGLALENFNALGAWRTEERGQRIDPSGTLITGESFENVQQLKQILVDHHSREFYRCLTEKLLTFALGRGLDYHDVQTVDSIVDRLEASGGKPSELVQGIVESAPFQRRRTAPSQSSQEAPVQVSKRVLP